jgi:LemA protein
MHKARTFVATLTLVIVALSVSGCSYNRLVQLREAIDGAWAQVENQLQRRNDLIPNLIEVTKGYAAHEKGIFEAVANARARMLAAGGSRDEQIAASGELSSALSRLLALAENYPNLKADAQFARLSDELAGTENRIATERRRYNEVVQEYNTVTKTFPAVITAKVSGSASRSTSRRRSGEAGAASEVLTSCAS